MLNHMNCLYILNINALLVISFANIFSHSVGCLFILLMVSFAVLKLFKFNFAPFLYFCFYLFYFRRQIQKQYCCSVCQRMSYLCFSASFIVSGLRFRSLIHFEFIFACGVREHTPETIRHWRKKLKMTQADGKIYHVLELEESILLKWTTQGNIQSQRNLC